MRQNGMLNVHDSARLSSSRTRAISPPSAPPSSPRLRVGKYGLLRIIDDVAQPSLAIYRAPDFEKRGVKLIGLSANGLADHEKWVKDINEWGSKTGPTDVQYPIVSLVDAPR